MQKGIAIANFYNEMNVMTADPVRLIVMMYEGAIHSLEEYKRCFQRGDYEAKARSLNRAHDIISELQASLNMNAGEIARLLESLYSYMLKLLMSGDLKRDLEAIEQVIGMLSELKEGWEGIGMRGQSGLSAPMPVKISGDRALAARI